VNDLLILLLIIPLVGAVLAALGKYFRLPLTEASSLLAVILCLGLLVVLYPSATEGGEPLQYRLGGWPAPVGVAIFLDGLAWISSLLVVIIALCAVVFAIWEKRYKPSFYFFFLLLVFGMEGVILTGDLFNMFVFLEIISLSSYLLIPYSEEKHSLMASFRYLLISSLGIALFLLGIFIFYQNTGTLSLRELAASTRSTASGVLSLELAIVCLAVGAGVRAAFVPFHTWLPPAHARAPHPVSAILSGVMIKVGFLVVWRFLTLFNSTDLQSVFLWVGAFTALVGVVGAIAQTDCKRLLAYHSVSQMGYIVASFGVGTSFALAASLYHLVNHSIFKSLLFLSIGAVVCATGERDVNRLGNLGRRMLWVFIPFLVGALSISGFPLFNGYVSKNLISYGLKDQPIAYGFVFFAAAGTIASFLKLSGIFMRKKASSPSLAEPGKRLHPMMKTPLFLLSLICIATGIAPGFFNRAFLGFISGQDPASPQAYTDERSPSVYTLPYLLVFGATLAIGVILYLALVKTKRGNRILNKLRSLSFGLNASLSMLIGGFILLVLLTWYL
jgi:multicomponent Na+:H+ antiporter subunit D